MPYNFCSVHPLLHRDQQDGQHFHAQHKPQSAKKVSPGEGSGMGMGRPPNSHVEGSSSFKKGPWTAEEDAALLAHVSMHGDCNWNTVRRYSGISRCGKSCRLRWTNHLRPNLRKGPLHRCEELLIIQQHALLGNRWSRIAAMLPGRTDNEVKNFWNTRKKRFQRAGLPLHPEDDTISSVEDVKGDMCETYLKYSPDGTASSKKPTHSWNSQSSASSDVMGTSSNWTYSAVSIIDSEVKVADLMPGFSDILDKGIHHGLEDVHDTQIVGNLRKDNTVSRLKGPSPVGGSSFYNLSDGVMAWPLSYLHGNYTIGSNTTLPYVPHSPGDCSSCFGSPRVTSVSSSCGTVGSSSSMSNTSISSGNTSSDLFSSFKQGEFLACLKVELPSVQIAESADSSSALFNPYATSQVDPSSELDRFNFTSDTFENKKTGSLIDILFQMKAPSQGQMQANVEEKTAVISPINASVENLLWMVNYNSLPFLNGCSPTLPNVNLNTAVQSTNCSSFGLCAGPPLLVELPTGREAFQLNPHMEEEMPNGLEIKDQVSAYKINEELITDVVGYERLKGFCGPEFLGESLYTGALFDQAEETVMDTDRELTSGVEYSDATSEFGRSEVTSDVVDNGMVSSSINAGAWVWSYMPGILQAGSACDDTQS